MTEDRDDEQLNRPETADEDARQPSIGAYLLDSLSEEERVEIDAYLAESGDARQEVRELAPVVSLLPLLLEAELQNDPSLAKIQPSAELRTRLLDAVRAEQPAPVVEETPVDRPIEPPIQLSKSRPHGRIRAGTATSEERRPSSPLKTIGRFSPAWLAAAVLAIAAVGAVIWALALQGTIDDKDREINALRQQSNASAWQMAPTTADQGGQGGTLFYSLQDRTSVLVVRNMPELPTDKVYQLWYIRGNNNPEPGGTFAVDDQGTGTALVDPDVPTYDVVALTEEPAGGSSTPSLPILLTGQLSGAAGAIPGSGMTAVNLAPPDGDSPQ